MLARSTIFLILIAVIVVTILSYTSTFTLEPLSRTTSNTRQQNSITDCPKNDNAFILVKESVKQNVEGIQSATTTATSATGAETKEALNPDKNVRANYFLTVANSLDPVTDKVTTHQYHLMYGTFLLPFYEAKPDMKFLEIGLGCDMGIGPGASVKLWKKLFPKAELWEAEFDEECVKQSREEGKLDGIHVLVGDQGNNTVLDSWIEQTNGGHFDVVIDDGGHHNCQIYHTFLKFWPLLNPGGLYFIEDLQAGRWPAHTVDLDTRCNGTLMVNVVKDWTEQIIDGTPTQHLLPSDTLFVNCQSEMCLIAKR